MGIVGRYIDALSDEQRDRIVEAKDWTKAFVDGDCRCLVGHAEDYWYYGDQCLQPRDLALVIPGDGLEDHVPAYQFPDLWDRFGKDRIVALCKARAARGNAPNFHEVRATAELAT